MQQAYGQLQKVEAPLKGNGEDTKAIQQLMSAGGEPDSPLNIDLAKLLRAGDLIGAEALVRFYTGLYARGD